MTATLSAPDNAPATPPSARPHPTPGGGAAARQRDERIRLVQLIMFAAGGVFMPLGVLTICLGWYGSAHSHYEYDQNVYLISGGLLGLGLVFLGGFLYFGAWLSRMAAEQKQASAQLTDAMLVLADVVAVRQRSQSEFSPTETTGVLHLGSEFVTAGSNTTVHRRECALIASRPDLRDYVPDGSIATTCRVCKPEI